MKIILIILNILVCFVYAQPSNIRELAEKLQTLESRLLSLEDFVQQQFRAILNEKPTQESWQVQQKQMEEKIHKLQQQLADTQAEIIRLKIALANIQKGETVQSTDKENPTQSPKPIENLMENSYRNPQINRYMKQMQATESSIRIAAVLELSRIEDEEANQALLRSLSDSDPYVKMLVIKSLAKRQAKIAISALLEVMLDGNLDTRTVAAKALQELTKMEEIFPYSASFEERQKAIQTWKKKLKQ